MLGLIYMLKINSTKKFAAQSDCPPWSFPLNTESSIAKKYCIDQIDFVEN